jgi:hypothetical protein
MSPKLADPKFERQIRQIVHRRYEAAMKENSKLYGQLKRAQARVETLEYLLAQNREIVEMAERVIGAGTVEKPERWRWLESTRKLQAEAFGINLDMAGDELADYTIMNALALEDEIHEALDCINWKNWAKDRGRILDRNAMLGEFIDAAHFLANLAAVVLSVSDDEWEAAYREKQERNVKRQQSGYDSKQDKCPGCRRELDKDGSIIIAQNHPTVFLALQCVVCGQHLGHLTTEGEAVWVHGLIVKNAVVPGSTRAS